MCRAASAALPARGDTAAASPGRGVLSNSLIRAGLHPGCTACPDRGFVNVVCPTGTDNMCKMVSKLYQRGPADRYIMCAWTTDLDGILCGLQAGLTLMPQSIPGCSATSTLCLDAMAASQLCMQASSLMLV
jgi:hypothetical protein